MKGILLAGGTGSRLFPLTKVINKHLLPVYNLPMIYFPLFTLKEAGITEVLIVTGKGYSGNFLELLGSGANFNMKFSYEVQEQPGGIAQALSLSEKFADNDKIVVILGDNIIEDNIKKHVEDFKMTPRGAKIFLKEVTDPSDYGVAEFNESNEIVSIIEKPKNPASNYAVTGLYMFDPQVYDIIRGLKPSNRNELEITDVSNFYLEQGTLKHEKLQGFWGDCGGNFDTLHQASELVKKSSLKSAKDIFFDSNGLYKTQSESSTIDNNLISLFNNNQSK